MPLEHTGHPEHPFNLLGSLFTHVAPYSPPGTNLLLLCQTLVVPLLMLTQQFMPRSR